MTPVRSRGPGFAPQAAQRKVAALEASVREYEEECETLADASLRVRSRPRPIARPASHRRHSREGAQAVTAALSDMVRFVAHVRAQRARAHTETWVDFAGVRSEPAPGVAAHGGPGPTRRLCAGVR